MACEIQVATNGSEVIEVLLKKAESGTLPDLVVLDLNLPRLDGLEILKFIRQSADLQHLTVAILTSSDAPTDRQAARSLGADRYIRKPSDLDSFMAIGATLKSLLTNRTVEAEEAAQL